MEPSSQGKQTPATPEKLKILMRNLGIFGLLAGVSVIVGSVLSIPLSENFAFAGWLLVGTWAITKVFGGFGKGTGNHSMLLAGLQDGVFLFDRNGRVSDERSQALGKLLPLTLSTKSIHEIFRTYAHTKDENIEACLALLWDEGEFFSDFESSVSMLPKTIERRDQNEHLTLKCEYQPIYVRKGQLSQVLVTISDISKQTHARAEADAMTERMKRMSLAVCNIEAYKSFLGEAISLIKNCDQYLHTKVVPDPSTNLTRLENYLHTLKGILGTFGYEQLVHQIHDLESELKHQDSFMTGECHAQWTSIKDRWKFESSYVEETLSLKDYNNKVTIDKLKLRQLRAYAEQSQNKDLQAIVDSFTSCQIHELFRSHEHHIKELCKRIPDKAVEIVFGTESDEITHDDIRPLENVLTHVFRNSFDHGIKPKAERRAMGKPETGTIHVSVFLTNENALHLVIKDDGEGIDGDKLAQKAVLLGHWTPEKAVEARFQDKLDLIFCPQLSTADTVTEMSGRGVGMDAVADIVKGLSGQITVFSEKGVGTQFEIDIPTHRARLKRSA